VVLEPYDYQNELLNQGAKVHNFHMCLLHLHKVILEYQHIVHVIVEYSDDNKKQMMTDWHQSL